MATRRKRAAIYQKRWHILATALVIVVPFVFLLIFSRFAHVAKATLLADTGVSLLRITIAYIIAASLGWLAAAAFYRGRRAAFALPVFDVLQSIPIFAALPLAIIYWGATNFTVIVFIVFEIIWPVFFAVVSALKLVRHEWEEAVEIAGLSGWNYIRYFLWPVSVPSLVTGSIVGLGNGWEGLIATEIIVNVRGGLGGFFQSSAASPSITVFGILGFLIIIFSINKLIWLPLLERSHHRFEE